nr:phage Gp37/Gp68 family protein [Breznakia pachnodae]
MIELNKTKIEWTDKTWNPITGCDQESEGCKNCYAKKMANRLFSMKNPRYINNFGLTVHEDLFDKPLKIKQPSIIFVCSMSDLFHKDVPDEAIEKIYNVMVQAKQHIFQVLTKRPERMYEFLKDKKVPDNIWIGTSVELSKYQNRIDLVKKINAKVKFLSCEPLLGSLKENDFSGIDWVVTGGESGSKARAVDKEWVREIRDKCKEKNIPFFFKQWGGWNKKKNGHELDGKVYKEMPFNK